MVDAQRVSCDTCDAGKAENSTTHECEACGGGQFSAPGAARCLSPGDCPDGEMVNAMKTGCIGCSAGKRSQGGDPCSTCPEDTWSGCSAAECIPCVDGSVVNAGVCKKGGVAQPSLANETACLRNAGSWEPGNTVCSKCAAGLYEVSGAGLCGPCPAAWISGIGAVECRTCEPGKITILQQSSCQSCAPGTHANVPGRTGCLDCPEGYVAAFQQPVKILIHFFSDRTRCSATATARILIPAECSAVS